MPDRHAWPPGVTARLQAMELVAEVAAPGAHTALARTEQDSGLMQVPLPRPSPPPSTGVLVAASDGIHDGGRRISPEQSMRRFGPGHHLLRHRMQ
jgi:hypothetical protein